MKNRCGTNQVSTLLLMKNRLLINPYGFTIIPPQWSTSFPQSPLFLRQNFKHVTRFHFCITTHQISITIKPLSTSPSFSPTIPYKPTNHTNYHYRSKSNNKLQQARHIQHPTPTIPPHPSTSLQPPHRHKKTSPPPPPQWPQHPFPGSKSTAPKS